MSGSKAGYNCKVSKGANQVLGIGNWSMSGMSVAELDDSEFGDEWKQKESGIKDGGTVDFAGNLKPGDTSGQIALQEAFDAQTEITDLRLYIDKTSYYEPCQTTGYLHPGKTTGANTVVSYVKVTKAPVNADKGALLGTSFSCSVSGVMVLV